MFLMNAEQAAIYLNNPATSQNFVIRYSSSEPEQIVFDIKEAGIIVSYHCKDISALNVQLENLLNKLTMQEKEPDIDLNSPKKIVAFCDFDGTFTELPGLQAIKHKEYINLFNNSEKTYLEFSMKKNAAELLSTAFSKPENKPLRLLAGVREFLSLLLESNCTIIIISKNREDYIRTVLAVEGFSKEELAKIRVVDTIKLLKNKQDKKAYVHNFLEQQKEEYGLIVICDDGVQDFNGMISSATQLINPASTIISGHNNEAGQFNWINIKNETLKLIQTINTNDKASNFSPKI